MARDNHVIWQAVLLVLVLGLAACSPQTITSTSPPEVTEEVVATSTALPARVVRAAPADLLIDDELLSLAGCERGYVRADGVTEATCSEDSPLIADLGCAEIWLNDFWAGIEGDGEILALCVPATVGPGQEWLTNPGCPESFPYAYVIYREDQFELVGSYAAIRDLAVPITSEQEALSYTLLMTDFFAAFEQERLPGYVYFRPLSDTHVVREGDHYVVHVFERYECGCGPFDTNAVVVDVQSDGSVEVTDNVLLYTDDQDDVCVD